jgi:hypothetical protein
MTLIDILLKNNWKPFRKRYNSSTKTFEYESTEFNNHYSTVVNGNLDYHFTKDNMVVVWGLNERYKPPTLQHPTSFIPQTGTPTSVLKDDDKARYILNTSPEEVYRQILNYYDNN